jgi:outer membrane immunogenic protein
LRNVLFVTAALIAFSGSAFASDLPNTKEPPVFAPPPPVFTWTGAYVGAQAGYEWGRTSNAVFTDPGVFLAGLSSYDGSGVVGGVHIGYNYQISQFVLGVEGDVEGSSYSGSATGTVPFTSYTTRIPVQGSIRGRVGIAWDRVLFYATGGVEIADIENTYASPPFAAGGFFALAIPARPAAYDSFSSGRVGWTVGGGVEYAIDPNWSVRAEYRYTDFGTFNEFLVHTYPGDYVHLNIYDNKVEVGASYKFDLAPPPTPIIAKY